MLPQIDQTDSAGGRAYQPRGIVAVAPSALGMMLAGAPPVAVETRGSVAVVRVTGPLSHDADPCMQDYGAIRAAWQGALKNRPAAVVLAIHSPGGDVAGMLDCARGMRADAAAAGIPCYAHTDGTCASAAYALACAMGSVSASAAASVGSIGVIAVLQNMAAATAAMGVEVTVLTSGARKADGNPLLPMTDAARGALQAGVDALAGVYFAHVAEMRGVDAAPLEAAMFVGAGAKAARLVDEIESLDELCARIEAQHAAPSAASQAASGGASLGARIMSDKASLRAALAKAAEDGDEDAKRALAAFDAKAGDSEDDDKKDAKAVKAESDEDDKKEDAKAVKAAAAASDAGLASTVASLAATVNALQAEKAATERKAFFAANPHISAEVQASLAHLSLEQVKGIVAALPKPAPNFAEAAGATATGTAGAAEGASGEITYLSPQARDLDIRMGLARLEHSVEHGASTLTLGVRKVVTGKGVSK